MSGGVPAPPQRQTWGVTTPPQDTTWANFTDDAPWVLDRSDIAWDRVAVVLRDNARREVPRLIKRRRLPPLGRLVVVVATLGLVIGMILGAIVFSSINS